MSPSTTGGPTSAAVPANSMKDLESVVLRSRVIAPEVSGVSCIAVNRKETEMIVARENGSLVLYGLEYFQNLPHFTRIRSTGGRLRRTITRIAFLDLSSLVDPASTASAPAGRDMRDRYFAASYLSGQVVLYDSETLFPLSVYHRTGGAVWDFTVIGGTTLYTAVADGSWHRLRVTMSRHGQQQQHRPTLRLERIIPRITGADRAFSVTASAALGIAVGTDDAGNVHAWRHATDSGNPGKAEAAHGSLSSHETLWTCRLPKGMAMCCAIADGVGTAASDLSPRSSIPPAVAVGTSMGDVVVVDALHGHILHTFHTHKGPVSTIVCDGGHVFYASGWHESLRAFRFSATPEGGEWYPAEVKRRTHYHEASQLLVLSQRQLMLSASRDGTVMFSPLAHLFSAPSMYVNTTTQRFAFAAEKSVLLQSRLDRIEAFRMDASMCRWAPLFAQNIHGKYHLNGLWCDARLHFLVFSTDERVVVSRILWRDGAEAALAIRRVEEVLELSAGRGLVDALFVSMRESGAAEGSGRSERERGGDGGDAASPSTSPDEGTLHLLFDGYVLSVTLAEGFPVVHTELTSGDRSAGEEGAEGRAAASIRPVKLVHRDGKKKNGNGNSGGFLTAYGLRGLWYCELTVDGTPNLDTARVVMGAPATYTHVAVVPTLRDRGGGGASTAVAAEGASPSEPCRDSVPATSCVMVGLSSADGRYVADTTASSFLTATAGRRKGLSLPKSLPHDVTFIAALTRAPPTTTTQQQQLRTLKEGEALPKTEEDTVDLVGYFGKGLLYVSRHEWRMVSRTAVEAAFVLRDRRHLLVLERNLEKTLEALPLCWKVRRFGN